MSDGITNLTLSKMDTIRAMVRHAAVCKAASMTGFPDPMALVLGECLKSVSMKALSRRVGAGELTMEEACEFNRVTITEALDPERYTKAMYESDRIIIKETLRNLKEDM